MFNADLYTMGFHNPCKNSYNNYCSCSSESQFCLVKNNNNTSCYCPQGACYGFAQSNIDWRCQGCVKSKVVTTIDPASATVIPGSAGGPNAEGNPGTILGDNEIYVAGTGADKAGTTQAQYILTSSGAAMSKSTFDRIRSNYHGDLMAWYLNECWKTICTTYANGGTHPCSYGTLPSLESFDCCSKCTQRRNSMAHYLGTCCNVDYGCGVYCFNSNCGGPHACNYGLKLYACAYTEFVRKFNLHEEIPQSMPSSQGCGNDAADIRYTVIDVGSSGGIVISPKSKAFSGDPLCINTGGASSVTSYAIHQMGQCGPGFGNRGPFLKFDCCGVCNTSMDFATESLTACVDDSLSCKYQSSFTCYNCCCWALPYYSLEVTSTPAGVGGRDTEGNFLEVSRETGGGSSDIFINEKYTGSNLNDEYLFKSEDPVFGGTGQICVQGTTLYSLPGLTQGGSAGGCIVKGNDTQGIVQTAYSGGVFPKGKPGYGGGGTVCGAGGTGLVVVYWN
jgi:hypothetical protein